MKNKTISSKTVLHYAVQAYYENGSKYIKNPVFEDGSIAQQTNKFIIQQKIEANCSLKEEHEQVVLDIINDRRADLLNIMSGNANDYVSTVYSLVNAEDIPMSKISWLAPLPKLYFDKIADQKFMETVSDSMCIGTPGDRIKGEIKLHKVHYIESRGFYVYTLVFEGNLICMFNEKGLSEWKDCPLKIGETYNFTAKVKRHGENKFLNNLPETTVNYIKFSVK